MLPVVLKVLLTLYILQAFARQAIFFFVKYEKRIARQAANYEGGQRGTFVFDAVVMAVIAALVVLQFAVGMEYLSFTTGLVVGMTLIQLYFHRYDRRLPADRAPEPGAPPIKWMTYAIQAEPGRPWLVLVLMAILFIWALAMLAIHVV